MKNNLLTIIILALLVVNIILSGIMMISFMGTNKKTADLVRKEQDTKEDKRKMPEADVLSQAF